MHLWTFSGFSELAFSLNHFNSTWKKTKSRFWKKKKKAIVEMGQLLPKRLWHSRTNWMWPDATAIAAIPLRWVQPPSQRSSGTWPRTRHVTARLMESTERNNQVRQTVPYPPPTSFPVLSLSSLAVHSSQPWSDGWKTREGSEDRNFMCFLD